MPPSLLFELPEIDYENPLHGPEGVERVNPHRGAMRLLDAIAWMSEDEPAGVAWKDVREDEFWVPGHIPGRPLFPGVLQLEAAAQLASFVCLTWYPEITFMGFAGATDVKFRSQIVPGDRLLLLGRQAEMRHRRIHCSTQGWVNGSMVFQAEITGAPM
jgi:3-hydroxyacyl-[acyl-carrier-protein] dehydratase